MEDYSEFQDLNEDSTMAELTRLARAQSEAEAAVAEAERELKQRQKALEDIAEKQLPELMDSIGLEEFTTRDGRKVKIQENIRASIPEAKRDEAHAWLRDIGNARMIKRTISAQLAMGQDELASKVREQLEALELDVSDKAQVHPSTLRSFITRRLQAGDEVPLDKFSIFRQRVSKLE